MGELKINENSSLLYRNTKNLFIPTISDWTSISASETLELLKCWFRIVPDTNAVEYFNTVLYPKLRNTLGKCNFKRDLVSLKDLIKIS